MPGKRHGNSDSKRAGFAELRSARHAASPHRHLARYVAHRSETIYPPCSIELLGAIGRTGGIPSPSLNPGFAEPLRLIAGSRAGSLWFSQDAFRRAGSRDKSLHIVEGATHIAMYDTPEFVKEAMAQLVPLYQNAGKASPTSNFVGPLSAHAASDAAASQASPA